MLPGSLLRRSVFKTAARLALVAILSVLLPLLNPVHAQPNLAVSVSGAAWQTLGNSQTFAPNLTNLTPGDSLSGELTLTNDNSFAIRYTLTTSATNPDGKNLREQLRVEIKTRVAHCEEGDGETLFEGPLAAASFGDSTFSGQPGERQLESHSSDVLCLQVTFPLSSGDEFQSATTRASMSVHAERIQ